MNKSEALGLFSITEKISVKDLKTKYRKLASKHHPDKEGGDAEKFKKIQAAYELLNDSAVDGQVSPSAFGGSGKYGNSRTGAGGWHSNPFSEEFNRYDYDSAFSDIEEELRKARARTGAGSGYSGYGSSKNKYTAPKDVKVKFEDVLRGNAKIFDYSTGKHYYIAKSTEDGGIVTCDNQRYKVEFIYSDYYIEDGKVIQNVKIPFHILFLGGKFEIRTALGKRINLTVPADSDETTKLKLPKLGRDGEDEFVKFTPSIEQYTEKQKKQFKKFCTTILSEE